MKSRLLLFAIGVGLLGLSLGCLIPEYGHRRGRERGHERGHERERDREREQDHERRH